MDLKQALVLVDVPYRESESCWMNWWRWRVKSPCFLSLLLNVCVLYTFLPYVSLRSNLILMKSNHRWILTAASTKVRAFIQAKAHGKSAAVRLPMSKALNPQFLQYLCCLYGAAPSVDAWTCVGFTSRMISADFTTKVEVNLLKSLSLCLFLHSDSWIDWEMLTV